MSKQLVLVTGATGHIGFRTLVEVLKAGYRARITVRKLAQVDKIKATKSIQPYVDNLESLEVPDITAPGAFDEAVKDVDLILHLASPIPDLSTTNFDVKKIFLEPAVNGTLSILKSAATSKTIKRVVITSSVVILDPNQDGSPTTVANVAPAPDPNTVEAEHWSAYRASKRLAYHATLDWLATAKPAFDLLHILPTYTQGRNELVTQWQDVGKGSNDVLVDVVTGVQGTTPRLSPLVFVDDVARLEVAALDLSKGKNGGLYIAQYPYKVTWAEAVPITVRLFPEAVKKGIISTDGKIDSIPVVFDSSESTATFGVEFAGLETMVQSLIGQYIELKEAA